jgi:AraC-like DNA-binding protein
MDIFNLPEDIFPESRGNLESIIFHYYTAPVGAFKGRSILNRNAISLVICGEKTMHFAEKKVLVRDDEFHFLSMGNCLVSMELSNKIIFKSILVFFDDKILTDFFVKYTRKIDKIKDKLQISPEAYIAIKKDSFVRNFIDSLAMLLQSKVTVSMEMKKLKFEEFLLYLLENYPEKLLSFHFAPKNGPEDMDLRKVVEANIYNKISIEELAFLCNLSLSTFKRRFSKVYGTSPNKWFLQKRMELAKNLLQNHNHRPSEVYYKVGYENHSSFSKIFKTFFGSTPKEFQDIELSFQR